MAGNNSYAKLYGKDTLMLPQVRSSFHKSEAGNNSYARLYGKETLMLTQGRFSSHKSVAGNKSYAKFYGKETLMLTQINTRHKSDHPSTNLKQETTAMSSSMVRDSNVDTSQVILSQI